MGKLTSRLAAAMGVDVNDFEAMTYVHGPVAWRKEMQSSRRPNWGAAGYRAYMQAKAAGLRAKGKIERARDILETLAEQRLMLEVHAEANGKGWPFRATPQVRRALSRYGSPYAAKLSVGYEYELPADAYND